MPKVNSGYRDGAYTPAFDEHKFRELVLYLAAKSRDDRKFGRTKLNKMLWASDMWAFGQLGDSITGATYKNREFGPAPNEFAWVTEDMVEKRELVWETVTYGGQEQKRAVPLRPYDLSAFTPQEVAVIDETIQNLSPASGRDVTRWTHDMRGWLHTKTGEVIPYESVFLGDSPISPEVVSFAKQYFEEHRAAWEKATSSHR